jgi:hypothetical protein
MKILFNIFLSFVLLFAMAWAFLPGGIGLSNYQQINKGVMSHVAHATWLLLLFSHLFALAGIWMIVIPSKLSFLGSYWWLVLPLVLHLIYFSVFATNLSAR